MDRMTFDYFLNLTQQGNFKDRDRYSAIVRSIEKFIGKKNIVAFYPKNLFIDEKRLSICIFQEQQVNIINELDNKRISLVTYKNKDITKTELIYLDEYDPLHLKVIFNNGKSFIEFNSHKDTNRHWSDHFKNKIEDIFKFISQK